MNYKEYVQILNTVPMELDGETVSGTEWLITTATRSALDFLAVFAVKRALGLSFWKSYALCTGIRTIINSSKFRIPKNKVSKSEISELNSFVDEMVKAAGKINYEDLLRKKR